MTANFINNQATMSNHRRDNCRCSHLINPRRFGQFSVAELLIQDECEKTLKIIKPAKRKDNEEEA